jgi:hypothetical protein
MGHQHCEAAAAFASEYAWAALAKLGHDRAADAQWAWVAPAKVTGCRHTVQTPSCPFAETASPGVVQVVQPSGDSRRSSCTGGYTKKVDQLGLCVPPGQPRF